MPKIEMGKSYRTKSGMPVRILCTDRPHNGVLTVVALTDAGTVLNTDLEGRCTHGSSYNLIEVKPRIKRELWVNVYPENHIAGDGSVTVRGDKDSCHRFASNDRIACVKIVIDCEEGEGLN